MMRNFFTLIEMVVVVLVIAVLAAVLTAAFAAQDDAAARSRCLSNMRQQGTAFSMYAIDNGGHYPVRTPYPHHSFHHRGSVVGSNVERWGLVVLGQYLHGQQTECPSNPSTHSLGTWGSSSAHDSYPVRVNDEWVMHYDHSVSGTQSWTGRYNYLAGTDTDGVGGSSIGREAYYERETGDRYYPALTDEARGRRLLAGESFYPGGFNHPSFRTWNDVRYWLRPADMTEGGHFLYIDGSASWSDAADWARSSRGERWVGLVGKDAEAAEASSGTVDYMPPDISLGFYPD